MRILSALANALRRAGAVALWLCAIFASAPLFSQSLETTNLAPESIQNLFAQASAGDPVAQRNLGAAYAAGNGVPQDYASAAKWFRKAADQNDADAQLRLGLSYLEGKGVTKDSDEAVKWFYKAAGHEADTPDNSAQSEMKGARFKKIITVDKDEYNNAKVTRIEPDGISITYEVGKGGLGMARLKFTELPPDLQKQFSYSAQSEAAFLIQRQAQQEIEYAMAAKEIAEHKTENSELAQTLADIAASYHKTHSYMTNDNGSRIYVCGDMACDVWDMVVSKGITASIMVGCVDQDISTLNQADHAWVLAELPGGDKLAIEATGGYVVHPADNKRYFFGCKFSSPREYRDFEHLQRQYNDALTKGQAAEQAYNKLAADYNSSDPARRMELRAQVQQDQIVLKERLSDLRQLKDQLDALKLTSE